MRLFRTTPLKRKPPKRWALGDRDYREWIRSQECLLCQIRVLPQASPTEAAHCGVRGMAQKASDRDLLPFCHEHHSEGPLSHHQLGRKFWSAANIDRECWLRFYREKYAIETGKTV